MKEIKTKRLILKQININDAKDMFLYAKDLEVGYNAGWLPHKNIDETKDIIKMMIDQGNVYGIYLTNTLIGTIDISLINNENFLGYALGKQYWQKGYMSEASIALLDDFFKNNENQILYANSFISNVRSQKLLKKLGFIFDKNIKINAFGEKKESYRFKLDYNKFKEATL